MDYKAKYEQWCQDPIFDKETKAELSAIAGDEKEIEDRFYKIFPLEQVDFAA